METLAEKYPSLDNLVAFVRSLDADGETPESEKRFNDLVRRLRSDSALAKDRLQELSAWPESSVRAWVAASAGAIISGNALPILETLLRDPDPTVQQIALAVSFHWIAIPCAATFLNYGVGCAPDTTVRARPAACSKSCGLSSAYKTLTRYLIFASSANEVMFRNGFKEMPRSPPSILSGVLKPSLSGFAHMTTTMCCSVVGWLGESDLRMRTLP